MNHISRVRPHQKHLINLDFTVMHVIGRRIVHECLFLFCAGKMKLNILARPLHLGLLFLCMVGFCSQLVSTGNQSSRGQTGRCQTQPDHSRSLRDSLWLLVTSLVARQRVQFKQQEPASYFSLETDEYEGCSLSQPGSKTDNPQTRIFTLKGFDWPCTLTVAAQLAECN